MKRQYSKPEVAFENFAFSANIANNCGDKLSFHGLDTCMYYANYNDPQNCQFYENGFSTFLEVAVCDMQPDETGGWSQVCYHVIVDEYRTFAS